MKEKSLAEYNREVLTILNHVIALAKLSTIEKKIMKDYYAGKIDAEIGDELGLTKVQVRGKRQNIYAKFGYQLVSIKKFGEEMKWPK